MKKHKNIKETTEKNKVKENKKKKEPITFTIPLQPITKKNHGQIIYNPKTKKRGFIPSKQYREYEDNCAPYVPARYILDPVNIKAVFYMKTRRKVDLTNLNEALHDVLVKYCCIHDDNCSIVVSTDGSRVKYDKNNPRTEVTIEFLDNSEVAF